MFWNKKVELKLSGDLNELVSLLRIFIADYLLSKEPDLKKLRIELMRPMLEANWDKNHAQEAEKINKSLNTKGEKIRRAWEQYKEDLLDAEKRGKDTSLIKAKLEVLTKLVE